MVKLTWLLLLLMATTAIQGQSHKEFNNLIYADSEILQDPELQALNLVIPAAVPSPPLFIWIGGGAWSYVDRHGEMDLARKFADAGIAVAVLGHRLSSATWKDPSLVTDNQHPDHINDVAAAVDWLIRNAPDYGYNTGNIFIGGYSSGAQLAALLCLDPSYLSVYGLSPNNIRGVIPIAGAYDIADYHAAFLDSDRSDLAKLHVEAVFGDSESDWVEASPTSFVENHQVPMLLISESGTYNYTLILEEKMKDKKNFEVQHYREMNHSGLWKDISFANSSNGRDRIIEWIKKHETQHTVE